MREGYILSILDLIITNEDNVIENLIAAADTLSKSDHIVMKYIHSVRVPEFNEELLDIDWDHLFIDKLVEECWLIFMQDTYCYLISVYVPIKTCSEFNGAPQ